MTKEQQATITENATSYLNVKSTCRDLGWTGETYVELVNFIKGLQEATLQVKDDAEWHLELWRMTNPILHRRGLVDRNNVSLDWKEGLENFDELMGSVVRLIDEILTRGHGTTDKITANDLRSAHDALAVLRQSLLSEEKTSAALRKEAEAWKDAFQGQEMSAKASYPPKLRLVAGKILRSIAWALDGER